MITFDEACKLIAANARPLGEEPAALDQAHGRVLAQPIIAAIDAPGCDVSTMDGYAVRESDLADLPARLRIAETVFPGAHGVPSLGPQECARIFTGAPVPAGADRVVMQEQVTSDGDVADFAGPLTSARFIRAKASDFAAGAVLLEPGTLLGPRQLVAVAAADQNSASCWRRPRVHLLATGDELAPPGTARTVGGAIPDSISAGLAAFVDQWGGLATTGGRIGDTLADLERAAARAADTADLVVVTGGASAGEKDFAKAMFAPLGLDLAFAKVAMKPGKPVWFGRAGKALVMGLPGNPTSAMVTARLLLAPLLAGMSGRQPECAWQWRSASLTEGTVGTGERETFMRGAAMPRVCVRPLTNQDSGAQHALAQSDLLIRRLAGSAALSIGDSVSVLDF